MFKVDEKEVVVLLGLFAHKRVVSTPMLCFSKLYNRYGGGWKLKYFQMQNKKLFVALHAFNTPKLQLATTLHTAGYMVGGSMPKGCMVLACANIHSVSNLENTKYNIAEVILTPSLQKFTFFLPVASQNIVLTLKMELFEKLFKKYWGHSYSPAYRLSIRKAEEQTLFQTISKVLYEYMKKSHNGVAMDYEKIEEEITFLFFGFLELKEEKQASRKKVLTLARLRKAIEQNLTANITIKELTEELKQSQRTAERTFADSLGISAKKYQQYLRLNAVYYDLGSKTFTTVKEVAQKYNFFHMGHFSKEFKKMFAQTPKQTQTTVLKQQKTSLAPHEQLQQNLKKFYG